MKIQIFYILSFEITEFAGENHGFISFNTKFFSFILHVFIACVAQSGHFKTLSYFHEFLQAVLLYGGLSEIDEV